jgi:hypothetical protein
MRGRARQELQGGSDVKRRLLVVMVLGVLVTAAVLVFVATASAGQVTKIMYAQENSDVYAYQNTSGSTGTLSVSIGWTDIATGVATIYPVGEVDGDIFSGPAGAPYTDLGLTVSSVQTLDVGTNPEVGSCSLPDNQTAYVAVLPFAGDNNYSIYLYFNSDLVSGYPKTAQAYGSNGEVYVPSDGDWISCAQYWPGGGANPLYASWSDQVYQRVAPGNPFDVLSAQLSTGFVAPQTTQRTIVGGSGHPQSAEWYGVTPQIWPGAKVPNTLVNGVPQPGTVSAATAPLWYTYSYPDASVSGNPVAYFWAPVANAGASKRTFSSSVATGASISAAFSGNTLTWEFVKGPGQGVAKVTIDGTVVGTVDQYAPVLTPGQTVTYTGLGSGNHTVLIQNNKTRNPLSGSTFISHDAFIANGVNDPSDPTPVMENNYDGETSYQWSKVTNASASGTDFSSTVATSAAAAFTFTGSAVTYKYMVGPGNGVVHVYIDGTDEGTIDLYNSALVPGSTSFTGLAPGVLHTILILNNKTKNPASGSTFMNVDAFVVGGVTYEN